jgi:hypothetical protein
MKRRRNMKAITILSFAAMLGLATGCYTPRQVAGLEGEGTRRVYAVPFGTAWRAAVDAAQGGGLEIVQSDRAAGYIAARRTVRPHTFGENVGIWLQHAGPGSTSVEVVSRQAGPPVAWLKNWENEIHRAIAANITRDVPAVGTAPQDTYIDPNVTERERIRERETIIIPERTETIVIPAPTTTTTLDGERRRYEELRTKREAGERALQNEVDETKREMLQKQIDRLREDIQRQQQRLQELEQEVNE